MTASNLPAHPARIKSYVRRGGRLTIAQGRALQSLSARFVLGGPDGMPDMDTLAAAFGRAAPLILEIGFGMGEATAQIARARPQENFLGCEVHEAGVGALLKRMGEQGMDNIRIVQGDAVQLIERTLPAGSLDGIHIFFPDPWHKKRHHKRRLIQPQLVKELALRLRPGGYLHCATDWQPYAEHMLHVLEGEALLRNSAADYAPRPAWRPQTKFETRGLRLGHGVRDLHFLRVET